MITETIEQTELDPVTGKGRVSHIVKQVPGKSAAAWVTEAVVEGLEVEALCGHRWVPGRNAKAYPVCPACEEVYFSKVDRDDGLPDV